MSNIKAKINAVDWISGALDLGKVFLNIVARFIPDKSEAEKAAAQLKQATLEFMSKTQDAQKEIILAEVKGESWAQRNWRPYTAFISIFCLLHNYILLPYLLLFFPAMTPVVIPDTVMTTLTGLLGVYFGGRSIEKAVDLWKNGTGSEATAKIMEAKAQIYALQQKHPKA